MQIHPLSLEAAAYSGATHRVTVTHADLTEAGAATAQTLNIAVVANKVNMQCVHAKLITPFADSADAANNSTTVTVGDSGSAARYLASMELNLNAATPVYEQIGVAANRTYSAADNVQAVFTPPAAKNLNALTQGEIHIFLKMTDGR